MLYYSTGEEVHSKDTILWADKKAIIEFIIEGGTQDAVSYNAPEGRIMLLVDWNGENINSNLETPVDGVFDEDITFVRRVKDENSK